MECNKDAYDIRNIHKDFRDIDGTCRQGPSGNLKLKKQENDLEV